MSTLKKTSFFVKFHLEGFCLSTTWFLIEGMIFCFLFVFAVFFIYLFIYSFIYLFIYLLISAQFFVSYGLGESSDFDFPSFSSAY